MFVSRSCDPASVEAAGFEPASRDIFMQASTYIVDSLVLAIYNSARQDL